MAGDKERPEEFLRLIASNDNPLPAEFPLKPSPKLPDWDFVRIAQALRASWKIRYKESDPYDLMLVPEVQPDMSAFGGTLSFYPEGVEGSILHRPTMQYSTGRSTGQVRLENVVSVKAGRTTVQVISEDDCVRCKFVIRRNGTANMSTLQLPEALERANRVHEAVKRRM